MNVRVLNVVDYAGPPTGVSTPGVVHFQAASPIIF